MGGRKCILWLTIGALFGASISYTLFLLLADAMAVGFTPNRMEFACLKEKFSQNSGLFRWRVEAQVGSTIYLKGSHGSLGMYPTRISIVLDGDLFAIPREKIGPNGEIHIFDVIDKRSPAPVCQVNSQDQVDL